MPMIVNLHLLRGLAASTVVIAHALIRVGEWSPLPRTAIDVTEAFGMMAVEAFFVVSGFIMIHSSADLFGGRAGAVEFARRRLVRIVPLYWLATLVEFALRARHGSLPELSVLLHSLLFIPQVVQEGEPLRPLVGVGWTLNYEAMFYLMFGLALLLPRRIGPVALLAALLALVAAGGLAQPLTEPGIPTTVFTFVTNRIVLMFGLGVVLGLAYGRDGPAAAPVRHPFAVLLAVAAASGAAFTVLGGDARASFAWECLVHATVLAGAVAVLFGQRVRLDRRMPRLVARIGDASYSIYLFHFLLIVAFDNLWLAVAGPRWPLAAVAGAILAAHLGGHLIYRLVERPTTRFLRRWTEAGPELRPVAPARQAA